MPIASLIALALSATQVAPQRYSPYNCQADLGATEGGSIAWVNVSVDGHNRPVRRELVIRMPALDATWRLGAGSLSGPGAMDPARYTLELPADMMFPVAVEVRGDQRRLWSGSFAQSAGRVAHYPSGESLLSVVLDWGRGHPVSNIYGVRQLEITVRDSHGATIRQRVPLPDWNWVARRSRLALAQAERQRQAGRCTLSAIP